jgi:trehalose-6-phosphatase
MAPWCRLAQTPTVPQLDAEVAATLKLLTSRDRLVTTTISGRAIEDHYKRIRLPGLVHAGNHGLEILGPRFRLVEPLASDRRAALDRLCEALTLHLLPFPGPLSRKTPVRQKGCWPPGKFQSSDRTKCFR